MRRVDFEEKNKTNKECPVDKQPNRRNQLFRGE